MNSLETTLKRAMKIEDLAMEIAGHTHRHELEHLIIQQILDDIPPVMSTPALVLNGLELTSKLHTKEIYAD